MPGILLGGAPVPCPAAGLRSLVANVRQRRAPHFRTPPVLQLPALPHLTLRLHNIPFLRLPFTRTRIFAKFAQHPPSTCLILFCYSAVCWMLHGLPCVSYDIASSVTAYCWFFYYCFKQGTHCGMIPHRSHACHYSSFSHGSVPFIFAVVIYPYIYVVYHRPAPPRPTTCYRYPFTPTTLPGDVAGAYRCHTGEQDGLVHLCLVVWCHLAVPDVCGMPSSCHFAACPSAAFPHYSLACYSILRVLTKEGAMCLATLLRYCSPGWGGRWCCGELGGCWLIGTFIRCTVYWKLFWVGVIDGAITPYIWTGLPR